MVLEFSINHQKLLLFSKSPLIAGSKRYLKAHFSFSDDWEGLNKIVYFKRKYDAQHDYYFPYTLDNTNTVVIPWEVLKEEGSFRVGCYGQITIGGVDKKIITCNYVDVKIDKPYLAQSQQT